MTQPREFRKSKSTYSTKLSTKVLVMASLLSAMSIVLSRYGSIMLAGGAIRLGFGNVPLILSGILLGPSAGALTGVVSDLIGTLLNSQGAFHLGFTISAALTGAIPGFVVKLSPSKKITMINIFIAHLLVYICISLGLNTFWLSQLQGKSYIVLLPIRALSQGIITMISTGIVYFLSKFFRYWR